MEIVFEKEYLEQLYELGKTKNKKYRYPKGLISKYKQTIDKLRVAKRIEDLFPLRSLNYEKLGGDKKGLESVRINKQYRIEFSTTVEGEEPDTVTICSIVEISKHYQ